MLRIPIGDLSDARDDPTSYRLKLLDDSGGNTFTFGYFNVLRNAIHHYHKSRNRRDLGQAYLETQLARFKAESKKQQTISRFNWYVDETREQGNVFVQSRLRVSIPLPARVDGVLQCSGEVGRIDILPSGGYAAWMLRSREAGGWEVELQMPLIQQAVARQLAIDASEVTIGVFAFGDSMVASKCFSSLAISRADNRLNKVIRSLGF